MWTVPEILQILNNAAATPSFVGVVNSARLSGIYIMESGDLRDINEAAFVKGENMLARGNQPGRRPFLQKLVALVGLSALPTRAQAQELQTLPSPGNPPAHTQMVFTGIRGRVMALDRTKGDVVWNNRLGGSDFVNLLFAGGDLYAATRGELFCLNVDSGQIRWHNPLKGYGRGLMTITTAEVSGNQVAAMQEKLRKEKEAVVNASVHTGG